jgi:hypothetical protein
MNGFNLSGTVRQIGDVFQKGNYTRCNVIIDCKDGDYDECVDLQFTQDRVAIAQSLSVGDKIDVSGVLKGRMSNDGTRAWTNLQVLTINVARPASSNDHIDFVAKSAKQAAAGSADQDEIPF